MKRIEYSRYGGPDLMRLAEFDPAAPGADEVLVQVKASAINPVDWKVRRGDMAMMTGRAFPRGMGLEFSGVVQAVGSAVTRLRVGDDVFGTVPMKASGAYAEVLVTKENLLAKKPVQLSFEQAACLCVAPLTAWRGLYDKARLQAGQKVFVNGCCGAVGRAAVQLARHLGAEVAGSCSPADMATARQLGVQEAFDYRIPLAANLRQRFDVVLDTAGTLSVSEGVGMLLPGRGVYLDINFTPARILRGLFSRRYKLLMGTQTVPVMEAVAALAADGVLQIEVGRSAPLAQAVGLIKDVEQGRKGRGRAVIVM